MTRNSQVDVLGVRQNVVSETLRIVGSLIACEFTFAVIWLVLHVPAKGPIGEGFEHLALTCIIDIPVVFVSIYLLLRLLALSRYVPRRICKAILNPLVSGGILGLLLALLNTYTKAFWILNSIF